MLYRTTSSHGVITWKPQISSVHTHTHIHRATGRFEFKILHLERKAVRDTQPLNIHTFWQALLIYFRRKGTRVTICIYIQHWDVYITEMQLNFTTKLTQAVHQELYTFYTQYCIKYKRQAHHIPRTVRTQGNTYSLWFPLYPYRSISKM